MCGILVLKEGIMVDIDKVLSKAPDGGYRLNTYVARDKAQELADALDTLIRLDPYKGKSGWVVDAVIAHAQRLREQGG
jgi:hypothetical protein